MKETGRLSEAERAFTRAATGAARRNRRRQAAEAHHDLLLLTAEQGRIQEAEEHALFAADLYPRYHKRLPYLAHDLAYALVRNRQYGEAVPLLDSFLREIPKGQVLPALSTFAWAAAGTGLVERFRTIETEVVDLLARETEHEFAPASFIHLAEGARLLMLWDQAEAHALRATHAAEIRNDPTLLQEARLLLSDIRERRSPAAVASMPPISRKLSLVSRRLIGRLQQWRPRPAPTP